ncbi:hypothetical protein B7C42_04528 [Nocardia cerradoensis]|uniref:Prokaryotic cytochrome C oxidase subunit IV family protein n=1 Tax=Nocardia cerradoensis TaxID=85688 RepID=A0A231H4B3_9NOCA|nr:cytochrome C oxidase subunit IV family protein [Nocardia cerradoensis]OXR43660.1 hypothetical protein B7C42_04528 [Nocardia cerradoensis]
MNIRAAEQVSVYRLAFFYVWLGLIAVTCLSFWLGIGHRASSAEVVNIVVIAVACLKIRFIGLYFMDLKDAPRGLRSIFESYCIGIGSALIALSFV